MLTAFTNVENNPALNRVHWSKDGKNLGDPQHSPIVYEGRSPVTAMIAYKGGVLTAFANVEGFPDRNRVHWSSDGKDLGTVKVAGDIRYEGASPITAMMQFNDGANDGVLTAFSHCGRLPQIYCIHWSPDGHNLGSGTPREYEGTASVRSLSTFGGRVLTGFYEWHGRPKSYQVQWSTRANGLKNGFTVYLYPK